MEPSLSNQAPKGPLGSPQQHLRKYLNLLIFTLKETPTFPRRVGVKWHFTGIKEGIWFGGQSKGIGSLVYGGKIWGSHKGLPALRFANVKNIYPFWMASCQCLVAFSARRWVLGWSATTGAGFVYCYSELLHSELDGQAYLLVRFFLIEDGFSLWSGL
ncbi:DCD (Development and Cell Death) domain protein [Actinidia rufa]|uniref:DCD (Development and Cell Death) domain protein n=1 Tax=Actinidia rufa TaxID=165716 RepID=A0A7J0F4X1_9ERIC|nr:DCD (Development and Cell Death) domain protein [Actinidia rufa]